MLSSPKNVRSVGIVVWDDNQCSSRFVSNEDISAVDEQLNERKDTEEISKTAAA